MKIKIETITPGVAREYLKKNTHNRPLKPAAIEEYAREMSAGRWALTHQGIAFDEEGVLSDGQNRLLAVIESGATVEMPVARGMTKVAKTNGNGSNGSSLYSMDVIDNGRKRSTGDQLHLMHGVSNGNLVAATARCIGRICSHDAFSKSMSVAQATGILDIYGKQINEIFERIQGFRQARRAPVIGALAFCAVVSPQAVYDLTDKLASGEGLRKGDPALALRNHLINKMMDGGKQNVLATMEWVGNTAYNIAQGSDLILVKRGHNGLDFFRAKQRGNVERVRKLGGAVLDK